MERNNITAEWAKKQVASVLGERVERQIYVCLDAIEKAVDDNRMTVSIDIYAEELTLEDLRKRGFTVKQCDTQLGGTYLLISW